MIKRRMSSMCSIGALVASLAAPVIAPQAAHAQAAENASEASNDPSGSIVVTARRREEKLLETPIAISAFTSEALTERGITNLQDLGSFVPGLNIVGQATGGGARADRSFVGVILRGMQPSTSAAQTTSMFIDGVPVGQATALQVLTNPARVEVLKGPQSATFGRQTFAGAINVVTKEASDTLTGALSGMFGTRDNYDASAELSGPLIGDVLGFRATARAFGKDGSYKNAAVPGETLGDQSSKAASLALTFKPTPSLTMKAFGLYSQLEDGPAATGYLSAYELRDRAGNVIREDQSNCNVKGSNGVTTRFFCGVAPGLSSLSPQADTANTAFITNFLANPNGRVTDVGLNGYGLVNEFYHIHLDNAWDIGDTGVTLRSLTGWNREEKSEIADLDNYNGAGVSGTGAFYPNGTYNFVFLVEGRARDFSQEVRLTYDKGGALQAAIGGSYLNSWQINASGAPNLTGSSRRGATQSKTKGIFGSLTYAFTPEFSLSADARYQWDTLYAFAGQGGIRSTGVTIPVGLYPEGAEIAKTTFKNFIPRVIANYKFDDNMIYASYSKGVNPGAFNTSFITATVPAVIAAAEAFGYRVEVAPEKITNYEIGLKGQLFDRAFTYDIAAFYAKWTDQIQAQSTQINVDTDGNGETEPYQVVGSTNTGEVEVKGLEANFSARVATGLTFDLAGAYIDSKVLKASNTGATQLTGIKDFSGKQSPFVSKWSGTAAIGYETAVSDTLDGFGRVDFLYKSGNYSDVSNIVRSPDLTQVNVRAGLRNKTYSIEAFVTNLFNDKNYYSVSNNSLIVHANPSTNPAVSGGLVAQLRELRTFGIRGSFNF